MYVSSPVSKSKSLIHLSVPQRWVRLSDLLPRRRVWKGKNSTLTVEKSGKHHLRQVMKVNIISDVTYP